VVEKGGEELKLRHGREENNENREWVAADGFSGASVARGSEGKKEGPRWAWLHGRGRRMRWGPGVVVGSMGDQQRPLAIRRGQRRCRATGDSGGARSTRCGRG
jgi:hypothetical protein